MPDRAVVLNPLPHRPVAVQVLPDFRLAVRFADGLGGEVDCRALVHGRDAGVFAALRDPQAFATAHLADGAVTWQGGLDLAPDAMYEAIARNAVWVIE